MGEKDYEFYKNHEDPDFKKSLDIVVNIAKGMNAWIRHPDFRPPVESWLIGATIEDFKPTDLFAISRYDNILYGQAHIGQNYFRKFKI